MDTSHLDALRVGLSHERARFDRAMNPGERALRAVWIAQKEREIAARVAFLGLPDAADDTADMTDDDLLAALTE
jgi:hypothetical protein